MLLSLSQIRSITFGAICVSQEARGIRFLRFTEAQTRAFRLRNENQGLWSVNASGICLDLHTDARAFRVQVAASGRYELLVDELSVFCGRLDPDGKSTLCHPLPQGDHRVTLVLPCHDHAWIHQVELPGASYFTPHTHRLKLAFHGDSITQGYNSDKDSQSYAWLISRYYDAEMLNLAVGGARFFPETIENVGFQADAAIVALGTNDFGTGKSTDDLRRDCADYLDGVVSLYPSKRLFCITPIWRAEETQDPAKAALLAQFRRIIAQEAEQRDFIVIDGSTLVPHSPEYFADQVLHPNDVGFFHYAMNLTKILNHYL